MITRTCEHCGESFGMDHKGMTPISGPYKGCWFCSHECRSETFKSDLYVDDATLRMIEAKQLGIGE